MGFAPLSHVERVPLLVLVGAVADKPVVIDRKLEIRPILPITATIDHRYVDGWHIGRAMRSFRSYLESPSTFETDVARRIQSRRAISVLCWDRRDCPIVQALDPESM